MIAAAADYYNMPLFSYIDHLREVRERYGDSAAKLEVDFAYQLQQQRIELANSKNTE